MKEHHIDLYKNLYPQNSNFYGKHLAIHPSYRGKNIGTQIITLLNEKVFLFFKTNFIWGSSEEVGALKLYRKLGVLIHKGSIEQCNQKLSKKANLARFETFLNTPDLKEWRLPNDITFAYFNSIAFQEKLLLQGFTKL